MTDQGLFSMPLAVNVPRIAQNLGGFWRFGVNFGRLTPFVAQIRHNIASTNYQLFMTGVPLETDWELVSSLALLMIGVIAGVILWRQRP